MKLAIITSRYPEESNPYNHMFVHVRAKYFKLQGVEVSVFVPSNETKRLNYEGISVIYSTSELIVKELDSFDVYYVHLLNFFPYLKNGGLPIYKFLEKQKKPTALGIHGSDVFKYPEYLFDFKFTAIGIARYFYKNYWNYPKMRKFVNSMNQSSKFAVVFPSKWMKNYTENHFNLKLKNPHVIANGIDTDLFKYASLYNNRFKLLTIRPFEAKYGVDKAIEVMRFLPKKFTLDIYGKGPDKEIYLKLIKEYDLQSRVNIIEEFVDRNRMNALFHEYGMFFALTLFDSQGVSMCEAMASGILTISNPVTAIPEFVEHEVTGILGTTPEEIAKRILEISDIEFDYNNITQNARSFMETIHWHKTGQKELEMLQSLC